MTYPLPPAVHRHTDMQLELAHLERGCVCVAQQISNQTTVFMDLFCSRSVGHSCRLYDCGIIAHIIDDPYVTMIQNRKAFPQNLVESCHAGALDIGFLHFISLSCVRSKPVAPGSPVLSLKALRR